MHKGYAFVQFTNQSDARSACTGEDGKSISGQVLDVNMVAEPKPHQVGRKRQNVTKTGNDCYCAPVTVVASSTPSKRPRLVTSPSPQRTPSSSNGDTVTLDQLKTYSSPDILICGNCREMFSDLAGMIDHKRSYCKLRFTCRCAHQSPSTARTSESEDIGENQFVCGRCKEDMKSAADLMMHAQTVHATGICQQDAKLHMNGPASSGSQRSPSTFSQASETSDAFNHTTNHPELMMISNDPLPMTEDELTILSESCIAEPV
ncbi:unnamed protein product [Notodromas monacha]|uniref:RRM domain-containing protein n=1 Tax=Notodromas monacha TaxID=399045 RepID=A0A7R9BW43_9CRUS|nr:unnamed protein product [Notodromas monacha]CAG0921494.1 unnamed protein product [Notodromas monacha]